MPLTGKQGIIFLLMNCINILYSINPSAPDFYECLNYLCARNVSTVSISQYHHYGSEKDSSVNHMIDTVSVRSRVLMQERYEV